MHKFTILFQYYFIFLAESHQIKSNTISRDHACRGSLVGESELYQCSESQFITKSPFTKLSQALAVSADGALRLWDLTQDHAEIGTCCGEVRHLFVSWLILTCLKNGNDGIEVSLK